MTFKEDCTIRFSKQFEKRQYRKSSAEKHYFFLIFPIPIIRNNGRFFVEIGKSEEILEIESLPTKSGELTGIQF